MTHLKAMTIPLLVAAVIAVPIFVNGSARAHEDGLEDYSVVEVGEGMTCWANGVSPDGKSDTWKFRIRNASDEDMHDLLVHVEGILGAEDSDVVMGKVTARFFSNWEGQNPGSHTVDSNAADIDDNDDRNTDAAHVKWDSAVKPDNEDPDQHEDEILIEIEMLEPVPSAFQVCFWPTDKDNKPIAAALPVRKGVFAAATLMDGMDRLAMGVVNQGGQDITKFTITLADYDTDGNLNPQLVSADLEGFTATITGRVVTFTGGSLGNSQSAELDITFADQLQADSHVTIEPE